ncbi:MAG TPA: hypothetical protein PKU88_11225 [Bacillota bacterium]|nr:hypothetical protein [Clostridiaceae bacterium]HNR04262.1 hypothetical protein [Bacillota bacterium]HNT03912.1 hypothetical protein [Bacillota bacterium]HPA55520.1 hypothetical protein [Bacillota bacterium]HPX69879.1 hypothetical protein [Bacillota bacterium]
MGRPWREEYKGGIYHVIARGNNKEYIFRESIDKGYFLKQLKDYSVGMEYRIYGYVLMDNHYHIIIQTYNKKLQEIMHQINNKYSKYFNYKYERVGHVFQGRYKAVLVQDERYMLSLLRYIHQNPIKAHICDSVEKYKWSSDVFYRNSINSYIHIEMIMDMLSKDRKEAIKKYKEYMEQDEEIDYDNSKAIGEEAYQIMCLTRKQVKERKRLDEILIGTGVSEEGYWLIKAGKRRMDLTDYKVKYAQEALSHKYSYKEIGDNIDMSDTGIRNLLKRN